MTTQSNAAFLSSFASWSLHGIHCVTFVDGNWSGNQSADQVCNALYLSGPGPVSTKGNSKTEMPCFCSALFNLPFLPASLVTTTWACCWHTVLQSWNAPASYTIHVCLGAPCQVTQGNFCMAESSMVCANRQNRYCHLGAADFAVTGSVLDQRSDTTIGAQHTMQYWVSL